MIRVGVPPDPKTRNSLLRSRNSVQDPLGEFWTINTSGISPIDGEKNDESMRLKPFKTYRFPHKKGDKHPEIPAMFRFFLWGRPS